METNVPVPGVVRGGVEQQGAGRGRKLPQHHLLQRALEAAEFLYRPLCSSAYSSSS